MRIFLSLTVFFMLTSGCGKNKNPETGFPSPAGVTNTATLDWKGWLDRYDAYIEEYILVMRRLEAGDDSAALPASDLALKGQTLSREAGQLGFSLSQQDRAEFEQAYLEIRKKLTLAGLEKE